MSVLGARAAAVRETIAELCERPPAADELVAEVAARVQRVIPYDTGAWMTTDPETMLPTGLHSTGSSPALHAAFARSEVLEAPDDVNNYLDMLSAGRIAAALGLDTGGDFASSRRYREIHVPHNQRDELRLIARSAGATWAIGCVSRADDLPDFTADEVRFVSGIAEHLGGGLRRALARPRDPAGFLGSAPGMVVLRPDMTVEASTGAADRWLGQMTPPFPGMLPAPVTLAAIQALANADADEPLRAARLRLQLPGGWLLIHADVLRQPDGGAPRVAVVLEPADRAELVPLLLALHGLTGREREVAELLISGLGTDEIAERLHISRHTLRDHVKAIFAKVGVTSRPELTAALAPEPLAA